MGGSLPAGGVVLVRHGATEWSESGRHTGRTDLPLLPEGRRQAEELVHVLEPEDFGRVLCSPMRRARETCELAGFGERAEITQELHEWDYGDFEGLTTPEIRDRHPEWSLWQDGCPGGESPDEVGARADQVIALAAYREVQSGSMQAEAQKPAILFAHGHILRVVSARWIGLDVAGGSRLVLQPAALGVLGHEREVQVIEGWNVSSLT